MELFFHGHGFEFFEGQWLITFINADSLECEILELRDYAADEVTEELKDF